MKANFNCSTSEIVSFKLDDIQIGDLKTGLEITQHNKALTIDFGDFDMRIDERGICFARILRRPGHDHDDTEYLVECRKTGLLKWMKHSLKGDTFEVFRMRFGPRTEGESE